MAKRVTEDGKLVRLEMSCAELADQVGATPETLAGWAPAIKPSRSKGVKGIYWIKSRKDLVIIKQKAALLKTGMSAEAVLNVVKENLLGPYAELAEDCPEGITVHVWRSYALIVLMQTRYGKMIGADELALRGHINHVENGKVSPDVQMAEKHIRLLCGIGYLSLGKKEWDGQWKHRGLPKAWGGNPGDS